MFDKVKFAQIIKNIKETYSSQDEFSKKSGIGRTYLSQYMNMKLDEPPKPSILDKLAISSNGIVSYNELMTICGYTSENLENIFNYAFNKYKNEFYKIKLSNAQINDLYKLFNPLYTFSDKDFSKKISDLMNALPTDTVIDLYVILNNIMTEHENLIGKYGKILDNEIKKRQDMKIEKNVYHKKNNELSNSNNYTQYYMCPVYGQISAGQPNWVEENIEGRLPIDINLINISNPEEYFFLRVNGESMNKIVKDGAFALIHKQDYVDNGEIAVVLINGFDATLKKFSKQGDIIVLTPESTDDSFKQQIYTKDTPIKVIGKYVGKMEFNK